MRKAGRRRGRGAFGPCSSWWWISPPSPLRPRCGGRNRMGTVPRWRAGPPCAGSCPRIRVCSSWALIRMTGRRSPGFLPGSPRAADCGGSVRRPERISTPATGPRSPPPAGRAAAIMSPEVTRRCDVTARRGGAGRWCWPPIRGRRRPCFRRADAGLEDSPVDYERLHRARPCRLRLLQMPGRGA